MSLRKPLFVAALLAPVASFALAVYGGNPALAQIAVRNQGYVPYSEPPINYRTQEPTDPVALLQKELDAGKVQLTYDDEHGYLRSVLKLLKVPVDSQTLVFSKTSFQYPQISLEHPRALYYNDDIYVGAVHQGDTIEIISFDPMQGAMFYLLDEKKADKPVFQRAELDCTQCHIVAGTRGVPGVLIRSVSPNEDGNVAPRTRTFITDQKSPWKDRWGGWYVTGDLIGESMANATVAPATRSADGQITAAPTDLRRIEKPFNAKAYLAPTSDQVALLVLAHQTQMHNLITLTNYQTRLGLHALEKASGSPVAADAPLSSLPEATQTQITRPAEQLVRYLLFAGETPLGGQDGRKVIASSAFAREFADIGVRDSKKRSLRDFDLNDRIFRYPCSYLIYSSAFDSIPEPAKGYVYHRLLQVLTGEDQSPDFAHLSAQDRQAILTILLETKSGLPAEWTAYARTHRLAALAPTRPR